MHVNGAWVWRNPRYYLTAPYAIDRDVLHLPDAYVEQLPADPRSFLRPTFDALWQSSGWDRSYGYTEAGEWDPKQHGKGSTCVLLSRRNAATIALGSSRRSSLRYAARTLQGGNESRLLLGTPSATVCSHLRTPSVRTSTNAALPTAYV